MVLVETDIQHYIKLGHPYYYKDDMECYQIELQGEGYIIKRRVIEDTKSGWDSGWELYGWVTKLSPAPDGIRIWYKTKEGQLRCVQTNRFDF